MKKLCTMVLIGFGFQLHSMSSVMNHRLVTTAPLLYKQDDYSKQNENTLSLEIEPWVSGMFDPQHTMENLGIDGKSIVRLDQLGSGDINPELILLASSNADANYYSSLTFTPQLLMYGALVHFYKQFEKVFFDIRTALIQCRTIVELAERGGDNGGLNGPNGDTIYNAYDAFTQSDWNYGKIGASQELIGFENIQIMLGASTQMQSFSSDSCDSFFAGFTLVEVPTGAGTRAEWMFEPQVGTNHWAFGFGADFMFVQDNEYSLVLGGNYRHFIANWETRSFDLVHNGQWSRYLPLDTIAGLELSTPPGDEGPVSIIPGINLFTQDALIEGRNQFNAYARFQKRFQECLFEFSYNFFYTQKETINLINSITPGFGLYDIYTEGGITTAHLARINQNQPLEDLVPVTLLTSDLDLISGAAGAWMSNSVAARLQRVQEFYSYGVGASVDLAHSTQAISTWSVWANFEVLLP